MNWQEAASSPKFAGVAWCPQPAALPTQPFAYLLNICWVERRDCPTMPPYPQTSEVSWKKCWSLFPLCAAKKQHRAQHPTQIVFQNCMQNRAVLPVIETQRSHCHPSWPCGQALPGDNLRPGSQFSTSLSETSLQNHISVFLFFQFIKPAWSQKPFTSLQCGIRAWKQSAPLHQAGRYWGPGPKFLPEKQSLWAHLDWRDWSFSQCKRPPLRCLPISENTKI